jgi:CheY-like chemotaxis protein/anti-sigma regulatory factor (Ser/Thr protein kinase)
MVRILVVDDLRVDRDVMVSLLSKIPEWDVETANDGHDALTKAEGCLPDVVVTDLQMPELNGFELVAAIRNRFPFLPVILVTAKGSEEIAIRALREGAASYVPKRMLAGHLVETVAGVLDLASKKRDEARLMRCLRSHVRVLEFEVENDRDLLAPLVNFLQANLMELGLCDESESLQVGMALDEALVNALYHGNLEVSSQLKESDDRAYYELARQRATQSPYRERRIHIHAELSPQQARIVMRDQGPGFDPASLPDPTDPENLLRVHGRGILLMRTFMDSVEFNDKGNEVTMIKRQSA